MKKKGGKAGHGCLIFILICVLTAIGLSAHPLGLRFIASQLRHEDRIFPSDILFVPRFTEDRDGDLYVEAFREYWAGNGRAIYLEEEKILGMSILEPVQRMARHRGIKEGAVRKMAIRGDDIEKAEEAKRLFAAMGVKKVILLVPDYASRRFRFLYGFGDKGKTVCLIKPVIVSCFRSDGWWKDGQSRLILLREIFSIGALGIAKLTGR